jgi:hypothetical protein
MEISGGEHRAFRKHLPGAATLRTEVQSGSPRRIHAQIYHQSKPWKREPDIWKEITITKTSPPCGPSCATFKVFHARTSRRRALAKAKEPSTGESQGITRASLRRDRSGSSSVVNRLDAENWNSLRRTTRHGGVSAFHRQASATRPRGWVGKGHPSQLVAAVAIVTAGRPRSRVLAENRRPGPGGLTGSLLRWRQQGPLH